MDEQFSRELVGKQSKPIDKNCVLVENSIEKYREIAVFSRETEGLDKRLLREFR